MPVQRKPAAVPVPGNTLSELEVGEGGKL